MSKLAKLAGRADAGGKAAKLARAIGGAGKNGKLGKLGKRGKAARAAAPTGADAAILDRLWSVVVSRRDADQATSHSARLLARGTEKVAQKFGEEAVECLIEAVARNKAAVVSESADVLYHLVVLWVAAGVAPDDVWAELRRREGVSGVAEKAARAAVTTRKIP